MKKFKKATAIITGAVLSLSMAGNIHASAVYQCTDVLQIEGYEQFEDYDVFNYIAWNGSSYEPYLVYRNEKGTALYTLKNPRYNIMTIKLNDSSSDKVKEIFSRYNDKLNYDKVHTSGEYDYCFEDVYDSDGNEAFDISSVPDKSEIVKQLAEELYEAGVVDKMSFSRVSVEKSQGVIDDVSEFSIESGYASEEKLCELVGAVSEDIKISSVTDENGYVSYKAENIKTFDEFISAVEAVKKEYPEAAIKANRLSYFNEDSETIKKEINMLDPYICDIDGSGTADVSDAALILSGYADSAANIQKAAENDKMDVNGDGAVNTQDASYVLAYYAEASAGMR